MQNNADIDGFFRLDRPGQLDFEQAFAIMLNEPVLKPGCFVFYFQGFQIPLPSLAGQYKSQGKEITLNGGYLEPAVQLQLFRRNGEHLLFPDAAARRKDSGVEPHRPVVPPVKIQSSGTAADHTGQRTGGRDVLSAGTIEFFASQAEFLVGMDH